MYAVITRITKDHKELPAICMFYDTLEEAREAMKDAFMNEGYANCYALEGENTRAKKAPQKTYC